MLSVIRICTIYSLIQTATDLHHERGPRNVSIAVHLIYRLTLVNSIFSCSHIANAVW